jgi:DNA processing protein
MSRLEWIALAWSTQLGPAAFHGLLRRFGSPAEVTEAGEEELRACGLRLTEEQLARLPTALEDLGAAEAEIESLAEEGVRVLCPPEPGYPPPMLALRDPPPVLCLSGEWTEADAEATAIVGTRSPTPEGAKLAESLAAALAGEGLTVVSGLARGIDTAAHRGALAGGGRTIAVLGSGIRVIHPHENRALAGEIAARGALVSELSPNSRPSVRTLMARNRLQSALSKAVIVVESGEQGGSLQTAASARRQGRLLFAVDWPTPTLTAAGTRQLLASGALPVKGVDDAPTLAERIRAHRPVPPRSRAEPDDGGQRTLF